jgi:hypothetical protein
MTTYNAVFAIVDASRGASGRADAGKVGSWVHTSWKIGNQLSRR